MMDVRGGGTNKTLFVCGHNAHELVSYNRCCSRAQQLDIALLDTVLDTLHISHINRTYLSEVPSVSGMQGCKSPATLDNSQNIIIQSTANDISGGTNLTTGSSRSPAKSNHTSPMRTLGGNLRHSSMLPFQDSVRSPYLDKVLRVKGPGCHVPSSVQFVERLYGVQPGRIKKNVGSRSNVTSSPMRLAPQKNEVKIKALVRDDDRHEHHDLSLIPSGTFHDFGGGLEATQLLEVIQIAATMLHDITQQQGNAAITSLPGKEDLDMFNNADLTTGLIAVDRNSTSEPENDYQEQPKSAPGASKQVLQIPSQEWMGPAEDEGEPIGKEHVPLASVHNEIYDPSLSSLQDNESLRVLQLPEALLACDGHPVTDLQDILRPSAQPASLSSQTEGITPTLLPPPTLPITTAGRSRPSTSSILKGTAAPSFNDQRLSTGLDTLSHMTVSSMELQHEASAISSSAEKRADTSTAPLPHSVGNSVNPQGASGDDASRAIMTPTRRFCAYQQQVASTMREAFAVVVKETKGGHEVDVGSHTSLAELQVQPLQEVPSELISSRPPSPAAVRAYAEYLGMDGVRDQDLFYIAQLALLAELPPSCTVHLDVNGVEYFYDAKNNVSSYEHPMDSYYRQMYKEAKERRDKSPLSFLA